MGAAIGLILSALLLGAALLLPRRPALALALLITLYGAEQMLMAEVAVFRMHPSLYNYSVGVAAVLAIVVALIRWGVPRPPRSYATCIAAFFAYTCLAALWTDAPVTAREWLTHFVLEVPLCVLVPLFTIRSPEDLGPPIRFVVAIAVLVSLMLLIDPAQSIGGRTYLVGEATVLSPAEMTGAALVLMTTVEKATLGHIAPLRPLLAIAMAAALYRSGARGQFLLATALPALVYLGRRLAGGQVKVASTFIGFLLTVCLVVALVVTEAELVRFPLQDRYAPDLISEGVRDRWRFVKESLTLERPIFGHGVAGWSFMHNGTDPVSKLDRNIVTYPHNSLVHVYFELGLVGLGLFVALIGIALGQGYRLIRSSRSAASQYSIHVGVFLYLVYSFGLSLKQNTYMSILGFYIAGAIIASLTSAVRSSNSGKAAGGRQPLPSGEPPWGAPAQQIKQPS